MNYTKEIKKEFPDVFAACLYGSRVSGYASKGSDIDVIVVLRKFSPKIRYVYKGDFSFLVVDKSFFEEDVKTAKHGDFVASRICNPIKPLINKSYFEKIEVETKERVVLYNLKKLVYKYRKKADLLEINALYFPFKRWNKLVQIYYPYRYSIENTLRNELRERNLKSILPGYIKAIKNLKAMEEVYPGWYKIRKSFIDKFRKRKASKELVSIYGKEIKKAVERYKTHKKAGAEQKTETVMYEITHKIERELKQLKRKRFKIILDNPNKYINFVPRIK